jgi:hypothetical protein
MTDKQKLRAKALELAILLQGPSPYNSLNPSKGDVIPGRHLEQARAIEKYILEAGQDQT